MLSIPFVALLVSAAECHAYCKPTPDSPHWPSADDWNFLNASVSGRLIRATAPGAVCFPDQPEYNGSACQTLAAQWQNSSYHRYSPVTVDFNDDTCSPYLVQYTICSTSGYPTYVIAAENASDVQEGIRFAARTGVRLTVKGTGHDFLGRSSGAGSLSIWMRALQGVEIGNGTAKVMAGMTVKDILIAAGKQNLTIMTGQDPDVGIGGWIAGGGHGPLTAMYGMGADQVIEMEIVTASGDYLTINEQQHSDLFWAMRGGGGSTYAVMISAIVKTYPNIGFVLLSHDYTALPESEDFWSMVTTFHNEIPDLSDSGVMGYYIMAPNISSVLSGSPELGIVSTTFLVPGKSVSEAQAILLSMEQKLTSTNITRNDTYHVNFSQYWATFPPGLVGTNARLGSRLLGKTALSSANLTSALRAALPRDNVRVLLGNIVAGRKPVDNAVLPAWRSTYAHVILSKTWEIPSQKNAAWQDLRSRTQALDDLAPDLGAYMSESDPANTNWQQDYYGTNYPRLLAIKNKWDPQGVFWCKACVGNELWTVLGGDGIGQDGGVLCRI